MLKHKLNIDLIYLLSLIPIKFFFCGRVLYLQRLVQLSIVFCLLFGAVLDFVI